MEFKLEGRLVGGAYPPLVIAEIGINHGGSLAVAKEMVDAAVKAGAEVIKHQTHIPDQEMSNEAKETIPANDPRSIYDIISSCTLCLEDERELKAYVEARGAIFLSTPFSFAAVDRLEEFGVSAFKVGSGECNNHPLLEYIAQKGKPVILSTGMNDIESVRSAVDIFRSFDVPFALLHCTSVYPTPYELVRLGGMTELATTFTDAIVGLSDHTIDNFSSLGAVALGASIIERHFTDSKDRDGPDIEVSMDPVDLQTLLEGSKAIFLARGGSKGVLKEETATLNFAFASVVASSKLTAGRNLRAEDLTVKRPGNGDFQAHQLNSLIGRKLVRDVGTGQQLSKADVE